MGRRGVHVRAAVVAALTGVALVAAVAPAGASVYSTPCDEVVVATDGDDAEAGLVAVSTSGTATGPVAISGTGDATSAGTTGASMSAQGDAQGGALAVAWDEAYAPGGVGTIALTGNGGGGWVFNICPTGNCG